MARPHSTKNCGRSPRAAVPVGEKNIASAWSYCRFRCTSSNWMADENQFFTYCPPAEPFYSSHPWLGRVVLLHPANLAKLANATEFLRVVQFAREDCLL